MNILVVLQSKDIISKGINIYLNPKFISNY